MPNKRPRSKLGNTEKITPEVKRGKSGLAANWVTAAIALLGLIIAGYQIYLNQQPKPIIDDFTVSKVEVLTQSPTSIVETGGKGIISIYWNIALSNLGESDLSIIKYEIIDKSDNLRLGEYYSNMDQGLYSCDGKYSLLPLPISISSGNTFPVCLKIGIVMDEEAYKLIKANFNDTPTMFSEIESFLWANGTDVYGNEITVKEHGISYPAFEIIKEQLFLVNFYSSRGKAVHRLIGYQICNGRVESQIPISCLLDDDLKFTKPQP
jgi:hypothetical protein